MFSTTVLIAMLDELDETRQLHEQLSAAVEVLSQRVKSLERTLSVAPARRALPPLPLGSVALAAPRRTSTSEADVAEARLALRSNKSLDVASPLTHDRELAPAFNSSSQLPGKSIPFLYRPFDGIFASLTREYNGNIVDFGVITIAGNSLQESHSSDLRRLFDYDWTGCWISEDVPGSSIEIAFGYRMFIITHYTLKTYKSGKGYSHLKSWDLDGMMAGKPAVKLDWRKDSDELNGRGKVHTFQCKSPSHCQGIRLIQTGPNHHGDHYLILRAIEIFGEVLA
jgi:hypothetical protein